MSQVLQDYNYTYLGLAATTQIFSGPGTLVAIVIGTTAADTIKVIDGTSGSTTNLALFAANIAEGTYTFNCQISTGLRIIAAANTAFTVIWKKS